MLEPKFVEARLHTDMPEGHPRYQFNARIQALREKYLGKDNPGLPQYVIVSPKDPDTILATKFDGARGGVEAFRRFFDAATSRAGGG